MIINFSFNCIRSEPHKNGSKYSADDFSVSNSQIAYEKSNPYLPGFKDKYDYR